MKPASAASAVAFSILASNTERLVRSTSTPRFVARAFDEVALPVSRHHTVVHLGPAHMDADHLGNLASPVGAPAARHAGASPVAKAGDELSAQLAAGLGVDGRVDRLVGHVALGFVGEYALEGSGSLLRRPLPLQQRTHDTPLHTSYVELVERAPSLPRVA